MHGGRTFLEDLALALCVAAVTTVVFQRLRLPVVLGYLLAGVIVGPHIEAVPLFANAERIEELSELGVTLVMFSVGLEFTVGRLVRTIPTAGLTGLVQMGTMMTLGYLVAGALGWTPHERIFTGAMLAVSSTMIVARVFAEEGVRGRVADLVFGVLVVEDIVAVVLLALLTGLASGAGLPVSELGGTLGRLGGFLVAMLLGGYLVVPRAIRFVTRLGSPETLLVASVGVCFAFALIAQKAGYSVALGAFVAGSLVAESGEGHRVERLVAPVRDVFAALFFVSVGMIVDPARVWTHLPAVLALTAVVLAGQVLSVTGGALLSGYDLRSAVRAGMSLAQIGEFSFIIATLGRSDRAVGDHLYPVAVAIAVVTAFTTPVMVRRSERAAFAIERKMPRPLQTFLALYGAWFERLRAGSPDAARTRRRRIVRVLVLDAVAIIAIAVTPSAAMKPAMAFAARHELPPMSARVALVTFAVALAVPFIVGVIRAARALGGIMAVAALPDAPDGKLDLAAAPRRALVVALQLTVVLVVGVPVVAVTVPFLPDGLGVATLLVLLAMLGVAFWRRATDLQEHVRAGAQVIIEALGQHAKGGDAAPPLHDVHALLPGLGDLNAVTLGREPRRGAHPRRARPARSHGRERAGDPPLRRGRAGAHGPRGPPRRGRARARRLAVGRRGRAGAPAPGRSAAPLDGRSPGLTARAGCLRSGDARLEPPGADALGPRGAPHRARHPHPPVRRQPLARDLQRARRPLRDRERQALAARHLRRGERVAPALHRGPRPRRRGVGAPLWGVAPDLRGEPPRRGLAHEPRRQVAWFFVGGALTGYGTRLAGGCTSGHGIFGVSRLQPASLRAVASFMAVGLVVSNVLYRVVWR
ncbi:MAG: cation:proton antiporter [Polyangiales bacterium]